MNGFDAFWTAYPRRVGKKPAERAWAKLQPDEALVQRMLAAIDAQRPGWTELRFVPHPATWLNQERWTDEVNPQPRAAAGFHLNGATWRDSCPHKPTCGTPTLCELKQAREASAWP